MWILLKKEEIIDAVSQNLKKLNAEEVNLQNKIAELCEELKIDKPF